MKRLVPLVIKASIFFVLSFSLSNAFANEVQIISPKNGDQVGGRLIVKGTSKVSDESHVWVFVHMKLLQDQWWPQPRPVVDQNGNWQCLVYVGQPQDVGMEFEIAVATFGKESESQILRYHERGRSTGQWLPISFPETTSPIEIVTVKRIPD